MMAREISGERKVAEDADLAGFFEAVGHALSAAQSQLAGRTDEVASRMMIANADLEIKATLNSTGGRLSLQTISTAEVRRGGIDPATLSTVRIQLVATPEVPTSRDRPRPVRSPDEVIQEVKARRDVAALETILGNLIMEAAFVSELQRWVVTARDPADRVVREVVLPDSRRRSDE